MHNKKGLFIVLPLGGLFMGFQLGWLEFLFSLLTIHFWLEKSVVGTLRNLRFTLSSLESLYKNIPPNIRVISEAKKI